MKKLLTHILVTIMSLNIIASVATTYADHSNDKAPVLIAAEGEGETEEDTGTNKLIIPKPSTLPGASESTQAEGGGIKAWLTEKVLPNWMKGMVGFVASLSFMMLVISGIRYITAYSNEEAATSAKKMVIYSSLALLLAMFSYTIVSIITRIQIG